MCEPHVCGAEPCAVGVGPFAPAGPAGPKGPKGVSAVEMLENSMRLDNLRIDGRQPRRPPQAEEEEDDEDDDHLELELVLDEPGRVTALLAESLGLESVDDAKVSALMKESLAVAERLAAASLMTSSAARRRLQARSIELGERLERGLERGLERHELDEYVPPRALLLYLVRMGSFSSAPRLVNPDSQDDGVELPAKPSSEELRSWCDRQLQGTPARLLSRHMSPLPPPPTWSSKAEEGHSIRVMQWNVLSQALGTNNDNFVACPEGALDWRIRRALILQELSHAAPDIICLQEVDHYKVLERSLGPLGYQGLWEPKPDSPCLYLQDNNGPDGCALMWRADLFTLLAEHRATLHVWRIPSNQVVLLAVLRHEPSGTELCVATTHLKARAGALMSTLRNEQGRDLLRLVSAHAGGRPVLLAGDFNAEPSEPVYRTVLQQPGLGLASAYSSGQEGAVDDAADPVAQSAAGEPAYTTWKVREEGEQCHTIDYIFYSQSAFSVSALLELPSGESLGEGRAPSYRYPSDHFSLCADLQLRSRGSPSPSAGPGSRCDSERTK